MSDAQEALPAGTMIRFSFKDFFWYCSGANRQILRQCSVLEGHKYVLLGIFVFSIGLLAGFSGGYALYIAFQSLLVALLFGLLWGAAISSLYRLIVSTIKKEASLRRQWMQAMPRFLLVLVLSVVIAKPLELRIFKPEIDSILADEKQDKAIRLEGLFDLKIKKLNERIAGIETETESLFNIRERLYQEYRCECSGACGTGKVGRGTECERKEAQYRQADQEYQALKAENDRLIAAVRVEASVVVAQYKALKAENDWLNAAVRGEASLVVSLKEKELWHWSSTRSDGLVSRISAAQELPILTGLLIALFVFMLGIAPVLFKVLAQRSAYDEALQVLEETRLKINL